MRHLFIALLFPVFCHAQFSQVTTVEVSDTIHSAMVDRPGDLYLTLAHGQFQKLDQDGKVLIVYKPEVTPDLFDPRDGARMFTFYRKQRRYAYLNPSFDENKSFVIDSSFVVEPWLICSSGDLNVWCVDGYDQTLKKVNPIKGTIDAEGKLPVGFDVRSIWWMKEYQGFLFVSTTRQVLVYNGIGKQIKTIDTSSPVRFLGEEAYYKQGDQVIFLDLFTGETRQMSLPARGKDALLTDHRLYLVQSTGVDLFETKPDK